MGYSSYDQTSRAARTVMYKSQSTNQKFKQNDIGDMHQLMNPHGVTIREARDSELHPESVPIIIGLDVTGSMGYIPENLIEDGLPKIIRFLMDNGVAHPQILFLAIGDHHGDRAPLQVGQFESGDEEMDMWLERVWLEGNGRGNRHESYLLAWYFAAYHTVTDAFEKRGKKGYIFTIGDELVHEDLSANALKSIMGVKEASNHTAKELLEEASKMYNVFHLHVEEGSYGTMPVADWRELMGEGCISLSNYHDIPSVIAQTIVANEKVLVKQTIVKTEETQQKPSSKPNKITW